MTMNIDVIYAHCALCRWGTGSWRLWRRILQWQTISSFTGLARYVHSCLPCIVLSQF